MRRLPLPPPTADPAVEPEGIGMTPPSPHSPSNGTHPPLSSACPPPAGPAAGPAAMLSVTPWPDVVIDHLGHDPRSAYVERFWLGVLGPSSIWLIRLMADRLDAEPAGFTLDLQECALSLGLGPGVGRNAPVSRTVTRLTQFGVAQRYGRHGLAVRRHLPPLAQHQLARLPTALQHAHQQWDQVQRTSDAA